MKRFHEQFKKQSTTVKLRAAERRELRARVVAYMEYHPLTAATAAVRPPAQSPLYDETFSTLDISSLQLFKWFGATTVLILIIVPILAERTVPGDTLYALKVGFNEEVRSSLSFTPTQKIEWETSRLNRRIAEARLLVSEGRLTEAVEADVASAVKSHTDKAQKEIDSIRSTDIDGETLAALELASTLDVQASTFSRSTTSLQTTANLIADALDQARFTESTLSSTTVPSYERLVAHTELQTTRMYEIYESIESSLSNEPKKDIIRRIADLERALSKAYDLVESDELAARLALAQIVSRTQRLVVFLTNLDVQGRVGIDTIAPLDLTQEELEERLTELETEIAQYVSRITEAIPRIEEVDLVEKLKVALLTITTHQSATSSVEGIVVLEAAVERNKEILMLAEDAWQLAEDSVVSLGPDARDSTATTTSNGEVDGGENVGTTTSTSSEVGISDGEATTTDDGTPQVSV